MKRRASEWRPRLSRGIVNWIWWILGIFVGVALVLFFVQHHQLIPRQLPMQGKDRYPYPVGYHSIRSQAGNICQMEIREGLKGPLFVITAVDGSSFSGQTPDIAWENFQKNCPKARKWKGKRFSNKIDGSEFFGFKNPSIQRLLRELVNMTQRRSLFSPFFCHGSKNKDQIHTQVSDQYYSLVPALEDKHRSAKKFWKKRNARKDIIREVRPKKMRPHCSQSDSKTCILHQMDDLCPISPDSKAMQLKRKHIVSHNEDSANEGIASNHRTSLNDIFSPIMHLNPSDFQCQKETKIISSAYGNSNEETSLMLQGEPEVNCILFFLQIRFLWVWILPTSLMLNTLFLSRIIVLLLKLLVSQPAYIISIMLSKSW